MTIAFRRVPLLLAAALLPAVLPGCKSIEVPKLPGVTPYRPVIQQGNFISQEMVAQLKPGMTKEQVRFVLGTPLVTDIFHADRWDYVFFREDSGGKREQRNLAVIFEKDRLARVIGDLMPAEGAAPQAGGFQPQTKPEAPAKPAADAPAPPKPAAEAKPVPAPAAEAPAPPTQNWRAASDEPAKPAEAAAAEAKQAEEKKAEEKRAEEAKQPGFFGRMRQKIGL